MFRDPILRHCYDHYDVSKNRDKYNITTDFWNMVLVLKFQNKPTTSDNDIMSQHRILICLSFFITKMALYNTDTHIP